METIEANWQAVNKKVLGGTGKMTFGVERQLLEVINKNIYHRKPPNLPVIFVEVLYLD